MRKIIALLFLSANAFAQNTSLNYPVAYTDTIYDNYFGTIVADPYRWLEEDTLLTTMEWEKEEAAFSEKYLNKLKYKYKPEQQLLLNDYTNFGTINKSGRYYFDYLSEARDESASLYIKKKIDQEGQKIIDPVDFKNDKRDKVAIKNISVSEDNKYIAFEIAHNGSDWREIYVKTLYPFHSCDDKITGVKFSNIEWSGNGFFYQKYPVEGNLLKEKTKNPSIWYHKLGDDQSKDVFVYEDNDNPDAEINFYKVKGNYLIIHQNNMKGDDIISTKALTINLNNNGSSLKIDTLISSHRGSYNVVGVYNDRFLVTTTLDAPHGKFILFSKNEKNKAEDFIPEHKEIIHSVDIVGNKILCTYLNDVDYINVTFDTSGDAVKKIVFPTGCSVNGFEDDDNDSLTIFYCRSFLYPPVSYQYNVNDFKMKLVDKTKVVYDYSNFEINKVYYTSKDGTQIPMLIANKKGMKQTGKNPTLLYGYGGYGAVTTPFYDAGFISFMENGGIIALPCIRGGGEYGAEWHRQGSRLNKQNVFDDFAGAAQYLFKENYTSNEHLAIMGGSNGGLLVAAVINQHPDICKAVIAEKGIFDMLRYQNYTIGKAWIDEYGASSDSVDFQNLIKYSPLHNVREAAYPGVLIITADHDDRVVPLHSYKYAAALQHNNKSDNPILLYEESNMGHTDHSLATEAYIYSFIYDQLKVPTSNLHTLQY